MTAINTDLNNNVEVEVTTDENIVSTPEAEKVTKEAEEKKQVLDKELIQEKTEKFKQWFLNRTKAQLEEIREEALTGKYTIPENVNHDEIVKFINDFFVKNPKKEDKKEKTEKKESNVVKIKLLENVSYKDKKLKIGDVVEISKEELKNFIEKWYEVI